MASACALAIFSGKIIYNFAFVAACGPLQTHFHEKGLQPEVADANFTVLALSVKPYRACQLSQRESPWHSGKVSGLIAKCAVSPEAPPLGELAR